MSAPFLVGARLDPGQLERLDSIAAALVGAWREIERAVPAGRERALCFTKLEEAFSFARIAVERSGKDGGL